MGRAWRENIMQKSTLVSRYAVVVVCIGFVAFAVFIAWSFYEQGKYAEEQMLAEARVLDTSVNATWQFIDYEQNNINRDRDGVYNFIVIPVGHIAEDCPRAEKKRKEMSEITEEI